MTVLAKNLFLNISLVHMTVLMLTLRTGTETQIRHYC